MLRATNNYERRLHDAGCGLVWAGVLAGACLPLDLAGRFLVDAIGFPIDPFEKFKWLLLLHHPGSPLVWKRKLLRPPLRLSALDHCFGFCSRAA